MFPKYHFEKQKTLNKYDYNAYMPGPEQRWKKKVPHALGKETKDSNRQHPECPTHNIIHASEASG